jgi:hypothetical protein
MAHKTVVVPSIIIVPIAAFSTDNAVRIIGEDISSGNTFKNIKGIAKKIRRVHLYRPKSQDLSCK